MAAPNATRTRWRSVSPPRANAGIAAEQQARPRSAQIRIGRRRSRSTQAPGDEPDDKPATSSAPG